MFETESEGVARLSAYLAQTKRQAEHSIDRMNQHITELQDDLETSKLVSNQLEQERDYFRGLAEQLQIENTKKWRLQERDDWKSLLESVQEDRSRLQEECDRLEEQLDMAKQLLTPDDLEVLEGSLTQQQEEGSSSRRAAAGENSSITRTPPRVRVQVPHHQQRRRHDNGENSNSNSNNINVDNTGENSDPQQQPPALSRHRSMVAAPFTKEPEPGGYIWPLSLIWKPPPTRSQMFFV
jgi:hypothetical protein